MGRLQNLQEAELLETYLGDNAHRFEWTSPHSAISRIRDHKHSSVSLQLFLENYPGQTAQITLRLSITAATTIVRRVSLTDPDQVPVMRQVVDSLLTAFKEEEERSDGNLNS